MDISRRSFVEGSAAALGAAALPLPFSSPSGGPSRRPDAVTRVLPPADDQRMAWWREARFGMFVHWGLYSILAGEWMGRTDHAEWIRNTAHIPLAEYDKLLAHFNPVKFDADAWIGMAKDAGMKYVTITSKHHDGFCLFDNRLTPFCIRNTPFRHDVMALMADASRRAGLAQCWYHSIMDWHHPDYLPRRDWEAATRPVDGARYARFIRYLHGSVEQLLKNYGEIGVMWFDGQWEQTWTHEMGRALYQECRALQPGVIVNNRVEGWSQTPVTDPLGDFRTPEQEVPATGWPGVDWESCITMNRNWGYNSHDHDFKSVPELVGLLVETASKGGNLLLNIGPRADGTFPDESVERLAAIGRWMRVNGDAIHGTTASLFASAPFRSTTRGNRIYLFLTEWPEADTLALPGLVTPVRRAWPLADPAKTAIVVNPGGPGAPQSLILPRNAPDAICSVVVLEFDSVPEVGA
jgi:alpha-L-fucosidase